jgi:hypothetical protein
MANYTLKEKEEKIGWIGRKGAMNSMVSSDWRTEKKLKQMQEDRAKWKQKIKWPNS